MLVIFALSLAACASTPKQASPPSVTEASVIEDSAVSLPPGTAKTLAAPQVSLTGKAAQDLYDFLKVNEERPKENALKSKRLTCTSYSTVGVHCVMDIFEDGNTVF